MSNKVFFLLMRGFGMFLREFKVSVLSLITLCALMFVYHIICTVGVGTAGFLAHIAQVTTIRAYLSDNVKEPEKVTSQLAAIEGVIGTKYYSPKDAKAFVIENAPNIAGMQSFAEEFFPAFVELTPVESSNENLLEQIEKDALKITGVDVVSYGKEFMSRFIMVSRGSWLFIMAISCLFAVAAAFTVFNTVKLSLYKFKEEIKLYSLVGGTRPFISVPYIFSSFLQVAVAYIISSVVFIVFFNIFNGKVLQSVGINIFYLPDVIYFVAVFLGVCLVSVLAAFVGVVSFLQRVSSVNED